MSVLVSVTGGEFKILYTSGGLQSIGYIADDGTMNEIIGLCRSVEGSDYDDVNYDNDDVKIIAKLFANTFITNNSTYILSDYEKTKVEINPYKYVAMIDHYFGGTYQGYLEEKVNDPPKCTIPWLFQFAKKYHITNLKTQSDLLSVFNSTLAGESKKKEELLDIVNRVEEQSRHRLQTRNRLSFINKDQIERMLFKNDFIRRTLFYLCLIIFVAFLSQFGLSKFMTNTLCFILFVTWAIHSFIMYNTFNTRHNLQFRMKVYSGDVGDISKNNIKYKNTDRCPNGDEEDDDKPKGKC